MSRAMLTILLTAFGCLVGAAVGSYLATVLIRWPQGLSASSGRSRCDACGCELQWHQLIPLLSFAMQRGRCIQCGAEISKAHLVMELAAAMIGGVSVLLFAGSPELAIATAVLGWFLLLLAALDWQHLWLPDRLTFSLALLGLGANLMAIGPGVVAGTIGMIAGFSSLWLIARCYHLLRGREGLGGGDPKLLAAAGAWLGWAVLPQLILVAALVGLLHALISAVSGLTVGATHRIPLGTMLALVAWPLWVIERLG